MQPVSSPNQSAPRSLADYTSTDSLHLRLEGRTVRAVIEELVGALRLEACPAALRHAALKAMNLELLTGRVDASAVTALVHLPGETRPRFVLGRAPGPLTWRAGKLTPIEFVVVLMELAPGSTEGRQVLAALARLNQDGVCLAELRAAQSAPEMLAVLARQPILTNEHASRIPSATSTPQTPRVISLGAIDRSGTRKGRWARATNVIEKP